MTHSPSPWAEDGLSRRGCQDFAASLPAKVSQHEPLVASEDKARTDIDPTNYKAWPHDRDQLLGDLWAMALANLPQMRTYNTKAANKARLSGRNFEPWHAILAVALWLETEHGTTGLFTRLEQLSFQDYQQERSESEAENRTRLLIAALDRMCPKEPQRTFTFTPSKLATEVNVLAIQQGIATIGESFTNEKRVGRLLTQLRFKKGSRSNKNVSWETTRQDLAAMARAHGIQLHNNGNTTNGVLCPMTGPEPRYDVCPLCSDKAECPLSGTVGSDGDGLDGYYTALARLIQGPENRQP